MIVPEHFCVMFFGRKIVAQITGQARDSFSLQVVHLIFGRYVVVRRVYFLRNNRLKLCGKTQSEVFSKPSLFV